MYEAFISQMDEKARIVAQVDITPDIRVSTVFLGGFMTYQDRVPKLFETMVFGGPQDGRTEKAETWEEAERNHRAIVILSGGTP
jgi:hypothetical protein